MVISCVRFFIFPNGSTAPNNLLYLFLSHELPFISSFLYFGYPACNFAVLDPHAHVCLQVCLSSHHKFSSTAFISLFDFSFYFLARSQSVKSSVHSLHFKIYQVNMTALPDKSLAFVLALSPPLIRTSSLTTTTMVVAFDKSNQQSSSCTYCSVHRLKRSF